MNPRLQRRIQRYGWDKAAAYYETYWKQQLAPAQTRLLEMTNLRPGERVLDIACGTGLVTFPAAEQVGTEGQITATDLSDAMVARVSATAHERGFANVKAEQMDAETLSYPDASFDAALCGLGLMYVPEPLRALQEMKRLLKPGGRAVSAVWGRRAACGWAGIFPVVDARVKSDVCPMFFQLGTGDALQTVFESAGFASVSVERFSTTLHYASAEAACGAAFAGGPVALAYARFEAQARDEAHTAYLDTIEPYRNGKAYAIPAEFVVVSGIKANVRTKVSTSKKHNLYYAEQIERVESYV